MADGAPGSGHSSPETVAVGGATLDRFYHVTNLPEPDGAAYARDVTEQFGGVGANVATGLARLGQDTALLARLGDDNIGDRVAADLHAGPVDTSLLQCGPGTTTHCIIPRGPNGGRMIVTAGNSTVQLELSDAARDAVRAAETVFVSAYVPDDVTRELLDVVAESKNTLLSFDLSGPVEELRDRGTERKTLDRVVRAADLFVAGEVAAESFLDCPASDAVEALQERGCSRGAVTFGTDGATLFEGDETTPISAFNIDAVDTTGAGDAFTAALTTRWLIDGADAAEAGRFAAATAARNCQQAGAQSGLPTRTEVDAFLETRGG